MHCLDIGSNFHLISAKNTPNLVFGERDHVTMSIEVEQWDGEILGNSHLSRDSDRMEMVTKNLPRDKRPSFKTPFIRAPVDLIGIESSQALAA